MPGEGFYNLTVLALLTGLYLTGCYGVCWVLAKVAARPSVYPELRPTRGLEGEGSAEGGWAGTHQVAHHDGSVNSR